MPDAVELEAEDAKLVTLGRSARARNAAAEGAAVRDDTGRTYVATTVSMPALELSALQAAVVMAVASGASALEAAAVVTASDDVRREDRAAVAGLSPTAPIFVAGPDGTVRFSVEAGGGPLSAVSELRVVVTASDYDDALRFYRDVLGLPERAVFTSPEGRVSILDAGRATIELADPGHAAYVDEVEVGRRVAGHIRLAFKVADAAAATTQLTEAGATLLAEPTRTPWGSLNSRLDAAGDLQLTLFTGGE
jgi:predicted enzyme related to lactoylglutathione lyase